ncbi:hypothetical protein [Sphingopyxis chilensis]
MTRLIALLLALVTFALPAHAADDISAASRSVVRVVTVAMMDGEVVGFGHGSGIAISPTRIVTNAHVVEWRRATPAMSRSASSRRKDRKAMPAS